MHTGPWGGVGGVKIARSYRFETGAPPRRYVFSIFDDYREEQMIIKTVTIAEAKQYIDNIGGFEKFAEWGLF